MFDGFFGIALLIMLIMAYMLPWLVSKRRKHRNSMPIFLVNLFLGWTGIIWFGALVWSFTSNVRNEQSRNTNTPMGLTTT